jgi:hypothetical protein
MPATYSIQVGTIIESSRKPDVFNVLQSIPNNTQKLIKPRDVRDAFLSTWANSAFKVTTPSTLSNFQYIGLDSGNPDNRDIKNKILIGKRQFGSLDVLNTTLLNSDTDIFFYNTKSDSEDQNSTKISILAGTNSLLDSPYIESLATASTIELNIKNPKAGNASINILSQNNRVSINGITFPTVANTQANIQSGKVLKYSGVYPNGVLVWDDPVLTITDIGSTSSVTNLYGSPSVYVNGYPLEFVEDSVVPVTVGGVTQGSSFASQSFMGQNWPLSEVIRNILYPEIEPSLSIEVINQLTGTIYAEVGVTSSFDIDWSVTTFARDSNEDISDIIIKEGTQSGSPDVYLGNPFIANPGSTTQSTFIGYDVYKNIPSIVTFSLGVSRDNTTSLPTLRSGFPTNYSTNEFDVEFIYPSFSGFSSTTASNSATLKTVTDSITKLIEPYPGTSSSYSISSGGSGFFYIIFPNSFGSGLGEPQIIKDPNGYIIYDINNLSLSNFTQSNISHPDYGVSYKVWRTNYLTSWVGTGEFEFIF